jgi:hypothetical protein
MKAILLVLVLLLVTGCACGYNSPYSCDTNCEIDEDCKEACPIGCVNVGQEYEYSEDIECESFTCACVEGSCVDQA